MHPTIDKKAAFASVIDPGTRLLVLGSLPGDLSLKRAEYYANPTNQFWRLMEPVVGSPLVGAPYAERLETLKRAGVGLWDVIGSAHRAGSLDSDIRDPTLNPLSDLTAQLPALRALAFNGGKAFKLGHRQLAAAALHKLIPLPSSSAAYCAMPFAKKQTEWLKLRGVLTD